MEMKYSLMSSTRDKIALLEEKMLVQKDLVEPICPLKHQFSNGVYVREITMPTGSIILGKEHTTKHFNIVSKGACVLVDIDTGELTDIIAPMTFESEAGIRKLLYIVEECVWSTIHVTEETDVDKLEATLVVESKAYKELKGGNKCLS